MDNQLAIITSVYNNYLVLPDFFRTLATQTNKNFQVFLVDASPEKQIPNIPSNIQIIHSRNLGYAHALNVGLKKATARGFTQLVVINSDIIFHEDFTKNVAQTLNSHPASLIGGKIYYAPGYEFHHHYAQNDLGKVLWYAGGVVDWENVITRHRGVDMVDQGQFNWFQETEFITGCFMAFDKNVLSKIGYWDESYFLYYEDADYCEKAKRQGIKLYYNPEIVLWHKNAQATGGAGSILQQKYQRPNRLRFGLKYAPFRTKIHLLKNYWEERLGFTK